MCVVAIGLVIVICRMKLCFATNNAHKIHEIAEAVGNAFEIVSLQAIGCTEELPENQPTLEGNSLEKAQHVWQHYGVSCFADDTGLEVATLNGEPGVYSARYAGLQRSSEDNITLLLEKLQEKPDRRAQFRTVITLILDGVVHRFEGSVRGKIIQEKRGNQGFGYDPVFVPEGHERTFAEMEVSEKSRLSHRGKAVLALIEFLKLRSL